MATERSRREQPIYVLTHERPRPPRLYSRRWRAVKRTFDLALALVVLPFMSLAIVVCAIAVMVDSPGPIVFRQRRTGLNGRRFDMYKFRTMVENAEEMKLHYAHLNILQPPDFKIPGDPRVTRIGRILRKTSLDEFPQIINILKGDMSFVGPRPTSFAPVAYDVWHGERLEVAPGLTGLWQVTGRGQTEFDVRLRQDIQYIRNWSFRLDIKLILLTFVAMFRQRGAL